MVNIIEALYNGKIVPWERSARRSEECTEIEKKIESERKYLLSKMSLDDREHFLKLENLYMDMCHCEDIDLYKDGFSAGMLLMLEVSEHAGVWLCENEVHVNE